MEKLYKLCITTFGNAFKYWKNNLLNVTNGQIDEVAIFNRALDSTEISCTIWRD